MTKPWMQPLLTPEQIETAQQEALETTRSELHLINRSINRKLKIVVNSKSDQYNTTRYSWAHSFEYYSNREYQIKVDQLLKNRIPIQFYGKNSQRYQKYNWIALVVLAIIDPSIKPLSYQPEHRIAVDNYLTRTDDEFSSILQQHELMQYLESSINVEHQQNKQTLTQRVEELERRLDAIQSTKDD